MASSSADTVAITEANPLTAQAHGTSAEAAAPIRRRAVGN